MGDVAQASGGGVPGGDPLRWTRGWRRTVLASGMLVYPGVTALGVAQYATGGTAVVGYAVVAAFCVGYLLAGVSFVRARRARTGALLWIMTALCAAEVPVARNYAFFLAAVVVSFAAMALRRYRTLIVTAGALAALVVPWAVRPWHRGPGWMEALMILFTSLMVLGFSEIASANRALLEARAEVAHLASEAERARIARDLHDLLGHSLTVVAVKSGLARRLAESGSPGAVREITEVEGLARRMLTDVRAAVSGYREVTLAGELARGRELLRAAGVAPDLPTATDHVDAANQELFGWVVREGITNVVRHARATRCSVRLSPLCVEIRDDGTGAPASGGNGLTGLRERVAAAGGTVEAGPAGPRGWRLRVTLGPPEPRRTTEGTSS
ncbi:sensor histidine kinase [Streptomyces mobaraensis NBRC 13819 = DSM 40847]|uniref:sensor histidine kinase n=1 Tax=Streptomyces mobaraensis TaxID=35621 RepID=UPI00068562C2|nr:sensor histidine kinase [Streptomyces mobaraensis]QTT76083.1 sensor histidine kinase [Streptomyces mobaraensis NBRC 13819 = DSM 40847]